MHVDVRAPTNDIRHVFRAGPAITGATALAISGAGRACHGRGCDCAMCDKRQQMACCCGLYDKECCRKCSGAVWTNHTLEQSISQGLWLHQGL